MKFILTSLLLLLLGYLAIVLIFALSQNKLLYYPSRMLPSPGSLGLHGVREVFFSTRDGIKVYGWFSPPPDGAPCLLHFHGNAGNIAGRAHLLDFAQAKRWGLLLFDYRGYGKSEGTPDESGFYQDSLAVRTWLNTQPGINPEKIIYWGESLGCAVALEAALHQPPAGLILEAPFTSIGEMGRNLYPWLPISLLLRSHFDNLDRIRQVHAPLLIIHGRRDEIVPFHHGQKLFEAANSPKQFLTLSSGHNDIFDAGGMQYQNALIKFIEECLSTHSMVKPEPRSEKCH
jgi:uncharacterized protein